MAIQDYMKAQKLAEKQQRAATSEEARYLPVLEDILRNHEVEGQIPLGQMEIPLSMIEGTAQSERTSAFAANFMPLLDYDTEFGNKWSLLCDSVREVGVNEPITVFEFMQRFYVAEGNKRVSVSKYFGAVSIGAVVTRIIPRQTDTDEYRIYSEFMAFHRVSGIYEIEMKQVGGFTRLMQAIRPVALPDDADGKPVQPEPWDDDLRRDVKFLYSVFASYYTAKIGRNQLQIKTGDAFVHFLEIYGFEQIRGLSSAELHQHIERIRGEFGVLDNDNPTSHILNPTEGSQKIALSKMILPSSSGPLKIAFLYPKKPEESGWVFNHEHGRQHIARKFAEQIETKYYVCPAEDGEDTIAQAIAEGCRLIFTTSPVYHACSMRMAVAHPEIIILNCSMNTAYQQLRTYYLRIYEAKFITGVIAGIMTETNRIGYIADYPVLGTPASIAAFALGVEMVNPRAKVYLDWSTLENHDPLAFFREKKIDLISDRDINAHLSKEADFGLHAICVDDQNSFPLAAPVLNWGSLYEDLVRSVLIGAWKNDANQNEKQALNYYWGMSSGAVGVKYSSDNLPRDLQKLPRLLHNQIALGEFEPFRGPICRWDGSYIVRPGQNLNADEIIALDWLPSNVKGRLPEIGELAPQYREFARWHSIHKQDSAGLLK